MSYNYNYFNLTNTTRGVKEAAKIPKKPTEITKESTEGEMVVELLGLKAQQLAGELSGVHFRVPCMHVMWCAQQAGIATQVQQRVLAEMRALR